MASETRGMQQSLGFRIWPQKEPCAWAECPKACPVALEGNVGEERKNGLQAFVSEGVDSGRSLCRTWSHLGLIAGREQKASALWTEVGLQI